MSLLLSISFTPAYRPVVSSLIHCLISSREGGGLLKHICHISSSLKRIYTLSGGGEASLSKLLLLHSENGSSLKGQKLLPFTVDPFSEGSCKAKKPWWHNTTRSEALIIRIWTNFRACYGRSSQRITNYLLTILVRLQALSAGLHSAVASVSDCRSRGGWGTQVQIPALQHIFRGDWPWNHCYGHSTFPLIQEGQLSFTGKSMCTRTV